MGELWEKHKHTILLVALVIIAFAAIQFPFTDGDLDKDILPVSVTYDNYYHPVVAKGIAAQETQRVYPPYRAMGIKNAAIADPPLHFSVPATFSKLVRMPFYQVHFFVSVLYLLWTSVTVYVLARRYFAHTTALLTAAFALVPASAVWLFPLTIGFTPTFEAFFFIPFIAFLLLHAIEHKSRLAAALTGTALAAQFLTHGPFEAGLLLVFITGTLGLLWWRTRDRSIAVFWLIIIGTAGILSLPQYSLMRITRLTGENIVETLLAGHPVPAYFPRIELGWAFAILLGLGALALGMRLVSRELTRPQVITLALIAFLTLFGFSTIVGVDGSRAYRMLYLTYPFFALVAGIGAVALWSTVKRRVPERLASWLDVIVVALIVALSVPGLMAGLEGTAGAGQATPERWQAVQWIRDHTPENARVFYLLGFEHEFGMLGERIPYKGDLGMGFTQRNIVDLCSGRFPETFAGQWGSAFGVTIKDNNMYTPVREGLFGIRLQPVTRPGTTAPLAKAEDEVPLSDFDYVVFQHAGTQADPCMAFFLTQAQQRGAKSVWQNSRYTILEVSA